MVFEIVEEECVPNAQAMARIWGQGAHVQCIHPVSGCIAGRDDVSVCY